MSTSDRHCSDLFLQGRPVIITGGAGFVGCHLVHNLTHLGLDVCIVDDLSTGSEANLASIHGHHTLVKGDVCDRSLLTSLIQDSGMVLHLASVVGMRNVISNPRKTIRTNVQATQLLAELCSQFNIPLVYVSSSAVYLSHGATSNGSWAENHAIYCSGMHPASIYGESKRLGELVCETYRQTHGLRYLIVRPFNLVGARQTSAYGMVLPTFVQCALRGQPLPIHGDGRQERTFSDVRQAVALLWSAALRSECRGQIINLATNDQTISILQLAATVGRVLSRDVHYKFLPYDTVYGPAYDDVLSKRPSLESLRRLIGAWDTISLEDTVRSIVEYELSSNAGEACCPHMSLTQEEPARMSWHDGR